MALLIAPAPRPFALTCTDHDRLARLDDAARRYELAALLDAHHYAEKCRALGRVRLLNERAQHEWWDAHRDALIAAAEAAFFPADAAAAERIAA
jgi:hypothetical protein